MTPSTPTVTIHTTAAQQPVVLTHLTAFLLRAHYAFLQTFHSAEHSDIDIFDQHQQLLIRCTIREDETDRRMSAPFIRCTIREDETDRRMSAPSVFPAQETLPEDLVTLIQALVQACTVTSAERQ